VYEADPPAGEEEQKGSRKRELRSRKSNENGDGGKSEQGFAMKIHEVERKRKCMVRRKR
jgi:hypothetical protein